MGGHFTTNGAECLVLGHFLTANVWKEVKGKEERELKECAILVASRPIGARHPTYPTLRKT